MRTCKDCDLKTYEFEFVMINDQLWNKISDNKKDILCPNCMENRMGRKICISDFKSDDIPCNIDYMRNERNDLYEQYYKLN